MFADYFKIAIKNIVSRKLRTFLTGLGVVISIAAIIALVSLGNGLKGSIEEQFSKMGTNLVTVIGGSGGDPTQSSATILTTKDVDYMESIPYYEYVTDFLIMRGTEMEYHNQKEYVTVMGMPMENTNEIFGDMDWEMEKGRFLTEKDKYGVMIGYKVWDDYYDRKINVNNNIVIKGHKFRVVGISASLGNEDDDKSLVLNMNAVREKFDKPNQVSMIYARVKDGYDPEWVAEKTEKYLERKRGDDHFIIMTATQMLDMINTILGSITFILSAIAFISLVVGSIGIMNSMYTNVLEKTNEIGIMKSIGAKNDAILTIFLLESGIIGLLGGIVGVILGQSVAIFAGNLITNTGYLPMAVKFDPVLSIVAILFSILIGVIAGYLPSHRASKKLPVDALRYD
jgi:putative ABC transport system permease protein